MDELDRLEQLKSRHSREVYFAMGLVGLALAAFWAAEAGWIGSALVPFVFVPALLLIVWTTARAYWLNWRFLSLPYDLQQKHLARRERRGH